MCVLDKVLDQKQKTGYKVAIEEDYNYYSPATGHLIKTGQVEVIRRCSTKFQSWLGRGKYVRYSRWFNENMIGRTSIFINMKDALSVANEQNSLKPYRYIVLKCIVSNELMSGVLNQYTRNPYDVVAGKYLKSFKKI
jgi:hypothetical protein